MVKLHWSAEQIGGRPRLRGTAAALYSAAADSLGAGPDASRPWVAELRGFSYEFDFVREFVRGRPDYTRANSRGTRGVHWHWTLESGRVYEICHPTSWKSSRRFFCEVVRGAAGVPELAELKRSEVVERLEELTDTAHIDRLEAP